MKNRLLIKIVCLMFAAVVIMPGISAFADAEAPSVTNVTGYTAKLYLSDWVGGGVVLKDVKPLAVSPETQSTASKLEYSSVPIFEGNIYSKSGAELDLTSLAWYLDMDVKFMTAHLSDGSYRIIYLVTQ